jgi:hypothetical protein
MRLKEAKGKKSIHCSLGDLSEERRREVFY